MSGRDLEALAVRCEQATGPDRELEREACLAVRNGRWLSPEAVPHYTSSLDAAMQLVPEKRRVNLGDLSRGSIVKFYASLKWPGQHTVYAEAATFPLALTAACLRAHSTQGRGEG